MVKKYGPYFLVFLFVAWASYHFFYNRKVPENKMALDWSELDKKKEVTGQVEAERKEPATLKTKKSREVKVHIKETLTPSEAEKFAAFDRVEQKWLANVRKIIGEKHYPTYLDMRERNEQEKMDAYKEYHDYLRQKHGDQFSYNISEDQSVREKKINTSYEKELLKLVGEETFKTYLKARDQINEESRRENKLFIQVEF